MFKVVAAQDQHRRSPLYSTTHLNVLPIRRKKATVCPCLVTPCAAFGALYFFNLASLAC